RGRLASLLLLSVLVACAPSAPPPAPPPKLVLTPASFVALPGWSEDHQGEALSALRKTCARRLAFADTEKVGPNGIGGPVADWRQPCASAESVDGSDDAAARRFFETWFQPWRCANNKETDGLFTGYYEPELRGARQRGGAFQTPLLKRPPDLVMVELGDFKP